MCDKCREILSAGLDLCIRARALDAQERTNADVAASSDPAWWTEHNVIRRAERHNALYPDQAMSPKYATIPLWFCDQYEKDLAEWERRARNHLMQGCDTPT